MNMSINVITLSGRLGAAPEIRNLTNGGRVAEMRLATEKSWKKKDDTWGKKVAWHTVVTFNEFLIKNLEKNDYGKGDQVTVVGELGYDEYVDNNGSKQVRAKIEVGAPGQRIENHTKAGARKASDDGAPAQQQENQYDLDDEIPF
jgi:single-strand DNA-binding protein